MKKRTLGIFAFLILIQVTVLVSAAATTCDLSTILLNQDPYPVIPGEAVEIVLQVDGLTESICGDVEIELVESFPFTLDKAYDSIVAVKAGTYVKDFKSFLLVPYKIKVDEDALEGPNQLDIIVSSATSTVTETFDIEVEDTRTDFEVSVKEYDPTTKTLTFQILNIEENDVEALTVDVPDQDNIDVKGSSRNIVGSLDANDDTTFSFEATPKDGDIRLIITYTDEINERRTLEKTVSFSSDHFDGRGEKQGMSMWFYVTLIIIALLLFRWWRNRRNKQRHHH